MGLNIYLFYNGDCEEAMNFYKDATGGTIDNIQRFGDTPMPSPEEMKNKIMHANMTINGATVMFSDAGGKDERTIGNNFSVALDYKDPEAMKVVFDKLSAGGVVTMPLQDTFWGATFGMFTDKFRVNWMFNHDKPKA
jgi:PhnB protein